jgi:hypothetical protein
VLADLAAGATLKAQHSARPGEFYRVRYTNDQEPYSIGIQALQALVDLHLIESHDNGVTFHLVKKEQA